MSRRSPIALDWVLEKSISSGLSRVYLRAVLQWSKIKLNVLSIACLCLLLLEKLLHESTKNIVYTQLSEIQIMGIELESLTHTSILSWIICILNSESWIQICWTGKQTLCQTCGTFGEKWWLLCFLILLLFVNLMPHPYKLTSFLFSPLSHGMA